jgi:hypothetical protein
MPPVHRYGRERIALRRLRLRPPLPQHRPQRPPSVRSGARLPQGFQPFLGAVAFEDVHSPGSLLVEGPPQEAGADQQVKRSRDLLEVIADVGGELLAAQDNARMPREEEEQVQVASVTQTDRANRPRAHSLNQMWNVLDVLVSLLGVRRTTTEIH